MKPEQQNIAIAEACGWKMTSSLFKDWPSNKQWCLNPEGVITARTQIPKYVGSLDAMHEAEKILTKAQRNKYGAILHGMYINEDMHPCYYAISATAPQRAEAFLRTIGKWVEITTNKTIYT